MNRMAFLLLSLCMLLAGPAHAQPITLTAADGVKVYGQYWPAAGNKAPLIVAFHQAGSSYAEYEPLALRLNKAGFGVLAIDQRSGGEEFGGKNRTAAALGREASYDDVLPDMEAALAWARAHANGAPVLVWGSSYSAALVFVLASRHPSDVQGLLAFSPSEYLGQSGAVGKAAKSLRMPVFIDQAIDDEEIASSRAILDVLPGTNKTLFLAKTNGVHGSATLRADRNKQGAEENWRAVLAFLGQFKTTP